MPDATATCGRERDNSKGRTSMALHLSLLYILTTECLDRQGPDGRTARTAPTATTNKATTEPNGWTATMAMTTQGN